MGVAKTEEQLLRRDCTLCCLHSFSLKWTGLRQKDCVLYCHLGGNVVAGYDWWSNGSSSLRESERTAPSVI